MKPYFLFTYKQKRRDDLEISSTYSSQHQSVYKSNMSNFRVLAIIFAILFGIMFVIVTISRIYVHSKYYPKECDHVYGTSRMSTLIQIGLWIFFENLGIFLYVYLLGLTGFWYSFFKWQQAASIILGSPSFEPSSYTLFYVLFWICFGACVIGIWSRIRMGAKVDILMIDWEKERFMKMRSTMKLEEDAQTKGKF